MPVRRLFVPLPCAFGPKCFCSQPVCPLSWRSSFSYRCCSCGVKLRLRRTCCSAASFCFRSRSCGTTAPLFLRSHPPCWTRAAVVLQGLNTGVELRSHIIESPSMFLWCHAPPSSRVCWLATAKLKSVRLLRNDGSGSVLLGLD